MRIDFLIMLTLVVWFFLLPEGFSTSDVPVIQSVSLQPEIPTTYDDIVCSVNVSDENGNLDHVRFRWYVNNYLFKTEIVPVSGNFSTGESVLFWEETHEGDEILCDVTVYDTEGLSFNSAVSTRIIYQQQCAVDVYGLEYDNGVIRAYIKNTGMFDENVGYVITIDNVVHKTETISLHPEQTVKVSYGYTLTIGEHKISIRAETNCGYYDEESIRSYILHEGFPPEVEFVYISPVNPGEYSDLTCYAGVFDYDGNLNYAEILWYVNGYLKRSKRFMLQGSDSTISDKLSSFYIQGGDRVTCRVNVYDLTGRFDTDECTLWIGYFPSYPCSPIQLSLIHI